MPDNRPPVVEPQIVPEVAPTELDRVKVARVVQELLDGALGMPDGPRHDWDDWVKALE